MQLYTVYLYLETALHISGGTSTHHQKRIQLYLHHLVFVTLLLLQAMYVSRNIEQRSLIKCCHGKSIIFKYAECVFVALVTQHAKCMPRR